MTVILWCGFFIYFILLVSEQIWIFLSISSKAKITCSLRSGSLGAYSGQRSVNLLSVHLQLFADICIFSSRQVGRCLLYCLILYFLSHAHLLD